MTQKCLNFICFFLIIVVIDKGVSELFPSEVRYFPMQNPVMPNEEKSLADCHFRYFKYAKGSLASSVFADRSYKREYAHLAKLGSGNDLESFEYKCSGFMLNVNMIVATATCAETMPEVVQLNQRKDLVAIKKTIVHPFFENETMINNIAVFVLAEMIAPNETITPSCIWLDDDMDFTKLEVIKYDSSDANFKTTKYVYKNKTLELDGIADTLQADLELDGYMLQVSLLSNFRLTPFFIGFMNSNSSEKFAIHIPWLQSLANNSFSAVDCAVRYAQYREYEDDMILNKDPESDYHSIQYGKSHLVGSSIEHYKVQLGWTKADGGIEWKCGGALIRENYVVTSASCIKKQSASPDVARFNEISRYYPVEVHGYQQNSTISQVISHPDFNPDTFENDIAVVKLDSDAKFSEDVYPACIWTDEEIPIDKFQTSGYGQHNLNSFSFNDEESKKNTNQTLLYVTSQILNDSNCPSILEKQICVGYPQFIVPGTCNNDFGGGMTRQFWHYSKFYDYIFGINSNGKNCGFGTPTVFTRISPYLKWIESVVLHKEKITFVDDQVTLGDSCKTKDGESGTCTLVEQCTKVFQQIKDSKINVKFCSFEKGPAVCCKEEELGNADVTEVSELESALNEIENCPNIHRTPKDNEHSYYITEGRTIDNKPYLASIKGSQNPEAKCVATLISKQYLLLAASCLKEYNISDGIIEFCENTTTNSRTVSQIVVHPNYDSALGHNNIALVKMNEPIGFTNETSPACLWTNATSAPYEVYSIEYQVENSTFYVKKRVPIYNSDCQKYYEGKIANSDICIVDRSLDIPYLSQETGAQLYSEFTEKDAIISYVVGIYNHGKKCEKDIPMLFTRVSSYVNWIKSVILNSYKL